MKYLLDTDTCSYVMRQSSAVLLERFKRISSSDAAISVITQGELQAGLAKKPEASQLRQRLERLNAVLPTVALPELAAFSYAQIRQHLERKGQIIGANDLWIAAHALAANLTLVTNNTREFARIPGLKLENWTDSPKA
jgi:tRNA(fMet)-specific endonuclease VapC